MHNIWCLLKREWTAYFITPLAYVFLIIFLFLANVTTFYIGQFYERGLADLRPFFAYHPWLYVVLVPAIAMRLWSEERRSGSIELLFTLPISQSQAVIAKFLAAWLFTGLALALTFPLWITVNYLGSPDNGVIFASYLGSWLMAGGFLAISSCISALTRNAVIAFIVGLLVCLAFVMAGYPVVLDFFSAWAPKQLVDTIASFSFLSHFESIGKGVIQAADVVYFLALIALWLFANAVLINQKKAN